MFNLKRWFGARSFRHRRSEQTNARKARLRLELTLLEDRLAPAVYVVTGLADGTGTVTPAGTGTFHASTLRAAIAAVNTSTTGASNAIELAVAGTYKISLIGTPGETDNAAGEFAIIPSGTNGSSLTIQNTSGGAVTVDANHLNRVFDINPNNTVTTPKFSVTMAGFTITNGDATPGDGAPGSGGGIRDQNNVNLTLTKITLSNNVATADGGGVSMENSFSTPWTLTLNHCTVTGNHAGDAGGGVETDGSGKVFINGGTISNNTSVNQGAGIWLDAVLASNGTVGSATVTAGGTGYTSPFVTINDPTGTGATGVPTVVNGTIISVTITNPGTGYTAPTITITDSTGTGAAATANLAVLQSANLAVNGTLITNNHALSAVTGVGGGIGNAGNGTVTIVNSTISDNTAGGVGGGFSDQNNMGSLVVLNSYFLNNVAASNGGAIQEGGPHASITYTQIQGNSSGGVGGGLFASGLQLSLQSSTIAKNISASNGGGIELATNGGGLNASTITDTTITGNLALNNADVNGGGIDGEETGDVTLLNDTINANFGGDGGGIFWVGRGTFQVQNTIIAANTIGGTGAGPDANNPAGNFTDRGGNLIGVSGAGSGNTGFGAGSTQSGTTANPLDPLLAALANNGGPVVGAPGATLPLQTAALLVGSPAFGNGTLFNAPPTDERGLPSAVNGKINVGAISNVPSIVPPAPVTKPITTLRSVANGTTTFNVTTTADIFLTTLPTNGVLSLRTAIQLANHTLGKVAIDLTVAGTYKISLIGTTGETDNAAGEFAIYQGGGVNPTSVTIQNTSGGAVTVDANHLNRVFDINPNNTLTAPQFSVTMTGFTITNGEATPGDAAGGSGGGIRDQGNVKLTLTHVTLSNNAASADGGGVSMENAPASTAWTLTLNNCTVTGNHAGDAGGGVETDGSGKTFINGGAISGNTSVNQGAGVWLDGIPDGVASVTINNPGTGYTSPPTVTFSVPQIPGGTRATGTATIVGGVVIGVTITNPGSGYASAPTVTFSAPPAGITATGTANLGFNNSARLTVTGAIVNGNAALSAGGLGGGIGNAGNGAVTITGSTIENNFAGATSGGFGDAGNLGTLTVAASYILNNTAVGNGGGLQEGGPTTSITTSQFQGNLAGGTGGGLDIAGNTLTLTRTTLVGNVSAGSGGGIELATTGAGASTSTTTNATIFGNLALNNADVNGGGIDAEETGDLTLLNDTINANFGGNGGGVFWVGTSGTFKVQNTIIAANFFSSDGTGPDANNPAGTFTDNGGNLIGISGAGSGNTGFTAGTTQTGTVAHPLSPLLGPLANNGGLTVGAPGASISLQTEAPLPSSKAIDKGVGAGAPHIDERGGARPDVKGEQPDVGAFESGDAVQFRDGTRVAASVRTVSFQ